MPSQKLRRVQKSAPGLLLLAAKIGYFICYFKVLPKYILGSNILNVDRTLK